MLFQREALCFELICQKNTSAILADNAFIRGKKVCYLDKFLWASLNARHDDKTSGRRKYKDSWDWLVAHGVTILQTHRPALLLQYLRKKNYVLNFF